MFDERWPSCSLGIDSKGERVAYSVYTKAGLMVHKQKTLDRVAALKEAGTLRTSDCDSGDYTKDWFINKVLDPLVQVSLQTLRHCTFCTNASKDAPAQP